MAKKGINQQLQELFDATMTKQHDGIIHTFGDFQFVFYRVTRLTKVDIYLKKRCPDNETRNLFDHSEVVEQSGIFITLFQTGRYIPCLYDGFANDLAEVMGRIANPEKEQLRNALTHYMKRIELHDKLTLSLTNSEDEQEELTLAKI
ncbi:hypothetical protein [Paraburkholderia aromaticivorans]|uniref:hypothetical protein n=1 Tax=Paraburkholderia aromaticivorans TaxID=2026199 RepID=UPI0038B95D06